MNNVFIEHRRGGKLVETRELHNVWTAFGKQYLSRLVAYQTIDPVGGDVPQEVTRLRYFGLGMGGIEAAGISFSPTFVAAYPPGFDPNASNGHAYNRIDPTSPPISTLERPIRISGSSDPYPGDPGDIWLIGPPNFDAYYKDINSVSFQIEVSSNGGQIVYGTFPYMPISEAALFTSGANINAPYNDHSPYNSAVAYINFATIIMQSDSVITFSWTVRFAT